MSSEYERSTVPERVEWIPENTEGEIPTDPEWNPLSNDVQSHPQWEPDANTQRQEATGEIEAQGYFNGPETHEATFEYHQMQWFVDGSANTVDPTGDFLRPSSDNAIRNTHAYLLRDEYTSGGKDNAGFRTYWVGKGGYPDSATIPFETEDGSPINIEAAYQFEKVRRYTIHQPSSSETLDVVSVSNNDTTQTVTIESEGAGTAENVTLDGTNVQTTTESFADIDAVGLDAETVGDVTITGSSSGTVFMVLRGQDSYPASEGDLGVPPIDTDASDANQGSHAASLSGYVRFLDDSLSMPNLSGSEIEIVSGSLEVDTGLDDDAVSGATARRSIYPTSFSYTWTASLAGKRVHVDQASNYLREQTGTITWTADEGTVDGTNAFIMSPGEYTKDAGDGKIVFDNEFESESLSIST